MAGGVDVGCVRCERKRTANLSTTSTTRHESRTNREYAKKAAQSRMLQGREIRRCFLVLALSLLVPY